MFIYLKWYENYLGIKNIQWKQFHGTKQKNLNIHIAASPAASSQNYNKMKTKPGSDLYIKKNLTARPFKRELFTVLKLRLTEVSKYWLWVPTTQYNATRRGETSTVNIFVRMSLTYTNRQPVNKICKWYGFAFRTNRDYCAFDILWNFSYFIGNCFG